jgi:AcrR family transcriptional regulator
MADSPTSTSDRILDASLKIFNQRGLHDVAALTIAMHIGISPGHLAYHFKTRNDIVLALFGRMEKEIRRDLLAAGQAGKPLSPTNAALHQIQVLRTLWRFRFFFNALTQVLGKDLALRERYMQLQSSIVDTMRALFDELKALGSMRVVPEPNSTRLLANACWLVWLSWLRFRQIEAPDESEVSADALHEGVTQTFSIIQPYFSPAFSREMLKALRQATDGRSPMRVPTATGAAGTAAQRGRGDRNKDRHAGDQKG